MRKSLISCRILLPVLLPVLIAACTVVPIEEDQDRRAQRSASFDADAYVARNWDSRIVPLVDKGAVPLGTLLPEIGQNLAATGRARGRQAAAGSPYVFQVKGIGTITAIDRATRTGSLTITLAESGGSKAQVSLLTGPVLVSSAIRDSLPFIDFNNFSDQLAFAAVSRALNARAMRRVPGNLAVGDAVAFAGAMAVSRADEPVQIVPLWVTGTD